MKDAIDALELLTSQHDEIELLLTDIKESDDAEMRLELFRELADRLAAHSTMEEKLFYPCVMSDETCEDLLEATEEHLAIKRVLADLLEMEPGDDRFIAKVMVLEHTFLHHARDEEEGVLFPKLRRLLTDEERAGLGNECVAFHEQLMIEGEPRMTVPRETTEAATLELGP